MLVIKGCLFLLSYMIVVILIGDIIGIWEREIPVLLINGVIALWGIFEVLAFAFSILKLKLSTVTIALLILMILGGIYRYCIKKETCVLKKCRVTLKKNMKLNMLKIVMGCLILFQIVSVSLFWHEDLDDATYVGVSVTSYYTNTINQISPDTGEEVRLSDLREYALSEFPVFWAMWARIFRIHPAILMRTFLPIFLIVLTYLIYWKIGELLFEKEEERYWFLIFLSIINLFGGFSVRSTSSFLLYRIWQGKAVLCNIIIPLYIYYYMRAQREIKNISWYMTMYLIALSAAMVSFTGVLIMPILIGICGIIDLFYEKTIKRVIILWGSAMPCLFLGALYAYYMRI